MPTQSAITNAAHHRSPPQANHPLNSSPRVNYSTSNPAYSDPPETQAMCQNSRAHSMDRRMYWSIAKEDRGLLLRESVIFWGRHLISISRVFWVCDRFGKAFPLGLSDNVLLRYILRICVLGTREPGSNLLEYLLFPHLEDRDGRRGEQ